MTQDIGNPFVIEDRQEALGRALDAGSQVIARPIPKRSHDELVDDEWTAIAMVEYGGSFVRKLGELFKLADDDNRERIKQTWPAYWGENLKMGRRMRGLSNV